MEDTLVTNDTAKSNAGELTNGFLELNNGNQDTLLICGDEVATVNFDELSNSNSNIVDDACDPLSDTNNFAENLDPSIETETTTTISTVNEEKSCTEEAVTSNHVEVENMGTLSFDQLINQLELTDADAQDEADTDLNLIVTKEELNLDYDESENTSAVSSLTIANVFTDSLNSNDLPNETVPPDSISTSQPEKNLYDTLERKSKKLVRSISNQAAVITSPEYLWLLLQLRPKCVSRSLTEEEEKIQEIIGKSVSEESRKVIDDILEQVKNFTGVEYAALYQNVRTARTNDASKECVKEFAQSIMWFKTHLQVEPEHLITKADLYNMYTLYCNTNSIKLLKSSEFGRLLRSIYPGVKERRRDGKGVKQYFYSHIKVRHNLHPPKLPKYAADQLHNNLLISQYMSSQNCCSLYSVIVLNGPPHPGRPKIKIKLQIPKSDTTTSGVDDPLELLNVSVEQSIVENVSTKRVDVVDLSQPDVSSVVKLKQVAKKSVFSKRIKRLPSKFREYSPVGPTHTAPVRYSDKLLKMKEKLSKLVIIKTENIAKYKVSCTCCEEIFFVTELRGQALLMAQQKLQEFFSNPKRLSKMHRGYHPSVKGLYSTYNSLILPEKVVHDNINPTVSIDRFEVYDWFKNEIGTLKRKLLESALTALNTNSRRSRYELKAPYNSADLHTRTPTQITPSHPPIYISAVREPPREPAAPKIAEVFIKAESARPTPGRKRQTVDEPEVIEISAQKKPRSNFSSSSTNTIYSRNRHLPYNRRKEADFIYFPAIDTSPNNLRLANLGTLYKCILCLMLFNTEQKLFDHEKAHLTCHKCRRKLRTVELMREHLMKHCERNYRKNKPILRIHRVDSIAIMVKKYGETFELSKEYYRQLESKPKKKYREMKRPKLEPGTEILPPTPAVEEVFINDVKPFIDVPPAINQSNNNIMLSMLLDVKPPQPLMDVSNIPAPMEMPVLPLEVQHEPYITLEGSSDRYTVLPPPTEPPKLVPFPTTSTNKKKKGKRSSPQPLQKRPFKIRVKDLMELS